MLQVVAHLQSPLCFGILNLFAPIRHGADVIDRGQGLPLCIPPPPTSSIKFLTEKKRVVNKIKSHASHQEQHLSPQTSAIRARQGLDVSTAAREVSASGAVSQPVEAINWSGGRSDGAERWHRGDCNDQDDLSSLSSRDDRCRMRLYAF